MNSLDKLLDYHNLDVPECSICLEKVATPIQLECGHIFDLDCIGRWFHENETCPLDRMPIDAEKVLYRSDLIKNVSAVFNFQFLSSSKVDPIAINIYSSVERLKGVIANTLATSESNPILAAFTPYHYNCKPEPKAWFCILNKELENKRLFSDYNLSHYELEVGKSYKVSSGLKLAQYGLPCDHCFRDSEKEKTCKH